MKEITRYKNRIKSTLFFYGIEIPDSFTRNQSYWSNSFMKWLSKLKLYGDSGTMTLQFLIEHVKKLRKDLLEINRVIRKLSQNEYYRNRVKLLMGINGIGLTTAMVILTEIDNIHRFSNQEKLAAYVGLIPTSHSSGDRDVHGEMVNRGNRFLKSAIMESAWVAARVDPVLHMDYIGYCKRMKKNKAIVRIARKPLNRINFVLKNQVAYKNGTE